MKKKLSLIFIFLFLINNFYLFILSKPLYIGEVNFVLKKINETSYKNENILSNFSLGNNLNYNKQDVRILNLFLVSPNLLIKLDKKFNLFNFYKSKDTDIIQRAILFKNFDNFFHIYKKNLRFFYEEETGLIHLSFSHYDKKNIKPILNFLITESENFLNNLNQRKALLEEDFIQKQMLQKNKELRFFENKIIKYQFENKVIDPNLIIKTKLELLNNLISKKIETSMNLAIIKSRKGINNIDYKKLHIQLAEYKNNIKKLNSELYKKNNYDNNLNKKIIEFNNLKNEYKFKKELFLKGLIKMEISKLDTFKKSKYLEIITPVYVNDNIYFPNKINFFLVSSFILLILYGILLFLINIIREHKI